MPPLVATASLKENQLEGLRSAFLEVHNEKSLDKTRQTLLIERFAVPDLAVYDETRHRAERVDQEPEWP
jgi:hypothetical protein